MFHTTFRTTPNTLLTSLNSEPLNFPAQLEMSVTAPFILVQSPSFIKIEILIKVGGHRGRVVMGT